MQTTASLTDPMTGKLRAMGIGLCGWMDTAIQNDRNRRLPRGPEDLPARIRRDIGV